MWIIYCYCTVSFASMHSLWWCDGRDRIFSKKKSFQMYAFQLNWKWKISSATVNNFPIKWAAVCRNCEWERAREKEETKCSLSISHRTVLMVFKMNCIYRLRSIQWIEYSHRERAPCSTLQQDKVIWHLNGIQFTLIEKVFQQLHLWCVCVQMCVCAYSLKTKECVAAEKCWLEEISIGCVASKGKSVKLPMCATTKNRLLK